MRIMDAGMNSPSLESQLADYIRMKTKSVSQETIRDTPSLISKNLRHLKRQDSGSIIIIVATDAPLDARQLTRLSKRATIGLARTGSISHHGSGDFVLAFSTGNSIPHYPKIQPMS